MASGAAAGTDAKLHLQPQLHMLIDCQEHLLGSYLACRCEPKCPVVCCGAANSTRRLSVFMCNLILYDLASVKLQCQFSASSVSGDVLG